MGYSVQQKGISCMLAITEHCKGMDIGGVQVRDSCSPPGPRGIGAVASLSKLCLPDSLKKVTW